MRRESHHIEPVSLWGIDVKENILTLKQQQHRELHQTLDIDRKKFSQYARKKRIKYNHKLLVTPDEIEHDADIQRKFFANLSKLPSRLIQKHVLKMMELLGYHTKQYKNITWDDLDKPIRKVNKVDQFNELHNKKIESQKELARLFVATVKDKRLHKLDK